MGDNTHHVLLEGSDPVEQRNEVLAVFSEILSHFDSFFKDMLEQGFPRNRLLTQSNHCESQVAGLNTYQAQSMIFNTRYQYHPFAIAMCESTLEVGDIYRTAIKHNLPVRIRAGGHDHAGECSGDNTILIDVTGIKDFHYDEQSKIATIGAGYRFYELTPKLAKYNRMIAHGTCATVGLTGFVQGGGWGPWTRKHGMCCENLVGATVVLGNGDVVDVSEEEHSDILWALRGGGGMSWGVVTQLKLKTFELPKEIRRFEITWNKLSAKKLVSGCPMPEEKYPTIEVLKAWEDVIKSGETSALLGTNLKINALPFKGDFYKQDIAHFHHQCVMYGYWEGSKQDLKLFIDKEFASVGGYSKGNVTIHKASGSKFKDEKQKYDSSLMGDWGRNSLVDVNRQLGYAPGKTALLTGTPFKPDYDAPAPHKISSKLVSEAGLKDDTGYKQLLKTLTSDLVNPENEQLGLFSYVTLGAIVGDFYLNHPEGTSKLGVAFPYQSCQYTIQYQTWWNVKIKAKDKLQNNSVFVFTNRALDWIDVARESEIEGSYGAFISFKDPAIPTEVYFQESYPRLKEIKECYVKDKFNHFRTRKTII